MNEQELRERMQSSVLTEFAPHPIDPVADVARGRRGLRRRRAVAGLTAAASVAAVAALGTQYLPAAEPPVAEKPSTNTPQEAARSAAHMRFLAPLIAANSQKHLGKARKYVSGTDGTPSVVRDGNAVVQLTYVRLWNQSGGRGALWVSIARPQHALAKEKWCGPAYTPDLLRMTCTDRLTPKGQRVVVGDVGKVQNSKGIIYKESGGKFVRYVRPDGQVVIAAVLGVNSLKRVADGLPRGVKNPDVTWQQLAAIATDPQLTLGK